MTTDEALNQAVRMLMTELSPQGHWEGELSSSALAGAVAIIALHLNGEVSDKDRIDRGCQWLAQTQNKDGGWGDCPKSISNPSTTILVLSAYRVAGREDDAKAQTYLRKTLGDDFSAGIRRIYGDDHTFSVPILMTCAVAGLVQWDQVPRLPYPLAVLPHQVYKMLRLQVVSYAMPALIAVGLAIDKRRGQRGLGHIVESKVLRILENIQPESGGFLRVFGLVGLPALSGQRKLRDREARGLDSGARGHAQSQAGCGREDQSQRLHPGCQRQGVPQNEGVLQNQESHHPACV